MFFYENVFVPFVLNPVEKKSGWEQGMIEKNVKL